MTELPASLFVPTRLTANSAAGFFLPHKPAGEFMLALKWDDEVYAMYLTGWPFHYFPITPRVSARGTLVAGVEFRVELESRYDAVSMSDPLGALVVSGGQLFIVGVQMGDAYAEPLEVPLWGEFEAGSSEEKVGFARWSIAVRDRDELLTIWSKNDEEEAVTN